MEEGDVLLALQGRPVTGIAALARLLDGTSIGTPCELTILRGSRLASLNIMPAEIALAP
jgi:S1-C subfamily serine protease